MLEDEVPSGEGEFLVELVITFENGTPADEIDAAIERSGGTILRRYPVNFVTVGFTEVGTALSAADYFGHRADVASCMPNFSVEAH